MVQRKERNETPETETSINLVAIQETEESERKKSSYPPATCRAFLPLGSGIHFCKSTDRWDPCGSLGSVG